MLRPLRPDQRRRTLKIDTNRLPVTAMSPRKKTNEGTLKRDHCKRKCHLPTINFQGDRRCHLPTINLSGGYSLVFRGICHRYTQNIIHIAGRCGRKMKQNGQSQKHVCLWQWARQQTILLQSEPGLEISLESRMSRNAML